MLDSKQTPLVSPERAELEAMVERLSRSPRLAKLLSYIGNQYLDGHADQVVEHRIAIDVFGRPESFDPAEDAIARVEAHRLRKKLTQHYGTAGRGSPIRISIPAGSYIPLFKKDNQTLAASSPEVAANKTPIAPAETLSANGDVGEQSGNALPPAARRSLGLYTLAPYSLALVACFLLVTFTVWRYKRPPETASSVEAGAQGTARAVVKAPATGPAVRILAGYQGQAHIDPSGNLWGPDEHFDRGGAWAGTHQLLARTNDPFLYQNTRAGEFSYSIPLSPGAYELHLYFVESEFGPGTTGGELTRLFSVRANGKLLLSDFDIESDAMGPNVADERVFKDIMPAADGKLHLEFESQIGKPVVSAIELVPGLTHRQIPIRLNTGSSVYLDRLGQVWNPDNYYLYGQTSRRSTDVRGSPDPALFATERFGHFSYAIPSIPDDRYTVTLYFAEFYFGPQASGAGGVGSRLSNVMCNGQTLLENLDIFQEVGNLHPLTKTFHHLKPTAQGKLNLTFEPVTNYPTLSAIEVLDESR